MCSINFVDCYISVDRNTILRFIYKWSTKLNYRQDKGGGITVPRDMANVKSSHRGTKKMLGSAKSRM